MSGAKRMGALVTAAMAIVVQPAGSADAADRGPVVGAARVGAFPARNSIGVLIGLQRSQNQLDKYLEKAADPGDKKYRRWLTVKQVSRRYGANPRTVDAVQSFLSGRGIDSRLDATRAFLKAEMTGYEVEGIFGTPLAVYKASNGELFHAPVRAPRLPGAVRSRIESVSGLDDSARLRPSISSRSAAFSGDPPQAGMLPRVTGSPQGCAEALASGAFLPPQIADAYNLERLNAKGYSGQGIRIGVLEGDGGFSAGDISTFAGCLGLEPPPIRIVPVGIGSALDSSAPNSQEATLDIEVLTSMAPKAKSIDVYESGASGSFAEVFAAMLDQKRSKLPDVISTSYGLCEPLWTGTAGNRVFDPLARDVMAWMISAAGVVGIPVVAAAGDDGSSDCVEVVSSLAGLASVDLPGSLPYVTAAGGTSVSLDQGNEISFQQTWNDLYWGVPNPLAGAGGGGRSVLYPMPGYQKRAGLPGKSRLVPDIALYADSVPGWAMYCTSPRCRPSPGWMPIGGTSAAAPLTAAGLALAAQAAKAAGQPKIGPVNPVVYEAARSPAGASVFQDITFGTNDLYGIGCCSAAPGYDTASGWGSVDFSGLNAALLAAWENRPK